jgi:hypothetical protein
MVLSDLSAVTTTTVQSSVIEELSTDALYYVGVTMYRDASSQTVYFHGVDFIGTAMP